MKYFIFSVEQLRLMKETDLKIGKIFTPGKVLVNGSYSNYTEILDDPKKSRFSDAKVVASGDLSKMKYYKPERK